jgi:hypothetical protein
MREIDFKISINFKKIGVGLFYDKSVIGNTKNHKICLHLICLDMTLTILSRKRMNWRS